MTPQQIYREVHTYLGPNGSISLKEMWRGTSEEYKPIPVPQGVFRSWEVYIYGTGWVPVDRPIWAKSLGSSNPQQDELE